MSLTAARIIFEATVDKQTVTLVYISVAITSAAIVFITCIDGMIKARKSLRFLFYRVSFDPMFLTNKFTQMVITSIFSFFSKGKWNPTLAVFGLTFPLYLIEVLFRQSSEKKKHVCFNYSYSSAAIYARDSTSAWLFFCVSRRCIRISTACYTLLALP